MFEQVWQYFADPDNQRFGFYLNIPYLKFQCTNCGFLPADLQWQCPQCKKWDTISLVDTGFQDSSSIPEHRLILTEPFEHGPGEEL